MKLHSKILLLLLLAFCTPIQAQTTRFFSIEQGLSSTLLNQIYQDKKGFLWIATENGLNRFDGNKFLVYKRIEGDSTSLKNNYVHSLFEDSRGNFYIGCIYGLQKYAQNTDKFTEIPILNESGEIMTPHVLSIIERKNGEIWLATSGLGIYSMKPEETVFHSEEALNTRLCSRFLTVIYEDSENHIWIGSENSGLNLYKPETDEVIVFAQDSVSPRKIPGNAIRAICERESGELMIGILDGGVCQFDKKSGHFSSIFDSYGNKYLPVVSLLVDKSNQLFVGTDGFGMRKYNPETKRLETFEPFSVSFNFSKAKIHSLLQDKNGNVWAGIFQRGILMMPENPNGFKYYGYKSFHNNSIGSNCMMAIYKDNKGIIWVGTDNDGLYAINEKKDLVKHFHQSSDPLVPPTITGIYEDGTGKLWLSCYLDGISLFDRNNGKGIPLPEHLKKTFSNIRVFCMTGDRKGSLWIGTYGNGLFKLNLETLTVTEHYYQQSEGDEGLSNNWINAMICDDDGLLWIATYNGLCRLNTATGAFFTYNSSNFNIPSNIITSLADDRRGNIWFGSDEGLMRLKKNNDEITVFTVADGLPSNLISAIDADNEGNIWVSAFSGLSKYSTDDNTFTNFNTSDGLQENEFTRSAHFVSAEGELFFGGINGITTFYPNDIHSSGRDLNAYITGLYHSGQNADMTYVFMMDKDKIRLASNENVITLELSTMDFVNPNEISYRYILQDYNTDWVNTSEGVNRISFTNIPHGKYKLMYQAEYKGQKSEIKTLELIINPPWYLDFWAKMIYFFLLLFSIFAVYRIISSRIRQKNEMLRLENADKINEAKLQFFINISHEIRTPMTLIMGPLEKLLSDNKYPELRDSHLLIYRNAQRILRLINQLMDIRKIDRGQMRLKLRETDIVGFIRDIMKAFEYMAQKKDINFEFFPEAENLKVWIDLNNFDKVLFNVFSNAFKFTPDGGNISVILSTGSDNNIQGPLKNYFEIKTIDTGIGIDQSKIDRIFERFYQIDNELTSANFGAGVGLHLSRSLIELQHGIIFAENRKDVQGSCFIIRMPLGKAHLRAEEMEILPDEAPQATFAYSKKDDLFDIEEPETGDIIDKKAKSKYTIVIAEDDREINNYLKAELGKTYKIIQTYNGKEALDNVLKLKPDLLISDIMMPEMDGITLCRKIKSNVNVDYIPIILLTAKSKEEDLSEGLETGADAYIVKPFNPSIVEKTIANLLVNRERLKGKFNRQSDGKIDKIELKSADEAFMEKVIKFINANMSNPDFSVDVLSKSVGVSRVHLHRKIKELTNYSPRDFIRYIRLKQAAELLNSKKLTVSEVAYAVGFSSLAHFSTSFREFYGLAPTEFALKTKPDS